MVEEECWRGLFYIAGIISREREDDLELLIEVGGVTHGLLYTLFPLFAYNWFYEWFNWTAFPFISFCACLFL